MTNDAPVAATPLPVASLRLDPQNPRLPQSEHGAKEAALLRYMFENAALEELAPSFSDNLYFAHEPVIVERKSRIVLEGNRRVATLKILLGLPGTDGLFFPQVELSPQKKKALAEIPCFLVEAREDVHAFLGYRHIGGIKSWSAESKARYIYEQLKDLPKRADDSFDQISRRTGLEKQAVRQAYVAYSFALEARERGVEAAQKLFAHDERRFGVLIRLLVSKDVRKYLGFSDSTTSMRAVDASLRKLKLSRLKEVIEDIAPPSGAAILHDSRDVTTYGRVLLHEKARSELRRTLDLDAARQIVDREKLPIRLVKIRRQVEIAADELLELGKVKSDEKQALIEGVDAIEKALGKLRTVLRGIGAP